MTTSLQTTSASTVTLPAASPILYSSARHGIVNREVGSRIEFGAGSIGNWRKSLVAGGMSNSEARRKINETLASTDGNLRWAQAQLAMENARSQGFTPSVFDSKARGCFLRLEKIPTAPKSTAPKSAPKTAAKVAAAVDALKAKFVAEMEAEGISHESAMKIAASANL
jgi:hypothetical protein